MNFFRKDVTYGNIKNNKKAWLHSLSEVFFFFEKPPRGQIDTFLGF